MKVNLLRIITSIFLILCFTSYANALPFQTQVQLDTDEDGTFDVTGIETFDWQTDGALVIENTLIDSSTTDTTLTNFLNSGDVGDTAKFNIHAHARLNDMLDGSGDSISSNLVSDGSSSGYEITTTLDGVESAIILSKNSDGDPVLQFDSIEASINFYLDYAPDSNVQTGTGFNDGTTSTNPFLTANAFFVDGFFNEGSGFGSSQIFFDITSYDSNIIDTDPSSPNVQLVGTRFASTVDIIFPSQGFVGVNDDVGDDPYTILEGDKVLTADAESTFTAVPEPTTMLLFGTGLIGLAAFGRKKFFNKK